MKKYARGNQMSFVTKDLSKKIMTRPRLRNKYLKYKTEERYVSLLRNLDEKYITDNKKS